MIKRLRTGLLAMLSVAALIGACSLSFENRVSAQAQQYTYQQLLHSNPIQYIKWLGFNVDWLDENGHLFEYGNSAETRWANKPLTQKANWNDIRTRSDEGKIIYYINNETKPIPMTREELWTKGGCNCGDFVGIYVNDYLKRAGLQNSGWTFASWHSPYRIWNNLKDTNAKQIYYNVTALKSGQENLIKIEELGLKSGDIVLAGNYGAYGAGNYEHAFIYVGKYNDQYWAVDCVGGNDGKNRGIQITSLSAYWGGMENTEGQSNGYSFKAVYRLPQGSLAVSKSIASDSQLCAVAGYSLKGAEFEVYDFNDNLIATLKTDEEGQCPIIEDLICGRYKVVETKAPQGFRLPAGESAVKYVDVQQDQTAAVRFADYPLFDPVDIWLSKKDSQTGQPVANAGFQVSVYLNSHYDSLADIDRQPDRIWLLKTNSYGQIDFDDESCLVEGELFKTEQGLAVALEGTYLFEEVAPPQGYLACEPFLIYHDTGSDDEVTRPFNTVEVAEMPEQKEVWLNKTDPDGQPVTGARLQLTDESGNPIREYVTDGQMLNISEDVELGRNYTVKEIQAPPGYLLSDKPISFTVSGEKIIVEIVDPYRPVIRTDAVFRSGQRMELAQENTGVIDNVHVERLQPGRQYVLVGSLYDRDDPENPVCTTEKPFTAEATEAVMEMEFVIDGLQLKGKRIFLAERLYLDGQLISEHYDPNDFRQTVFVPAIATEATCNGAKTVSDHGRQTIIDHVTYQGIFADGRYRLKATLIDQDGSPLTDQNGRVIAFEKEFIADDFNGSVDVEMTIDGSLLKGGGITVFEDLYYGDQLIAVHHDLNDPLQSLTVLKPSITTQAQILSHQQSAHLTVTLEDKVYYENLIKDEEYELETMIINRSSGEVIESLHTVFTSKEGSDCLTVQVSFTADEVAGGQVVIFEKLYHEGKLICQHCDPDDEKQTVSIPDRIRNVEICKVSRHDEQMLAGALLEVYDLQGELIDRWWSQNQPHVIEGLTVGQQYVLHEVQAPPEYLLADDVQFIVTDDFDESPLQVFMSDERIPQSPPMGDYTNLLAYYLTAFISLAGYVMIIMRRKTK